MSSVHFAGDNKHSARKAGHQVKNNVFYKLEEKRDDCSMLLCLDLDMQKNPNQKLGLWFMLELGINIS